MILLLTDQSPSDFTVNGNPVDTTTTVTGTRNSNQLFVTVINIREGTAVAVEAPKGVKKPDVFEKIDGVPLSGTNSYKVSNRP